MSEPNPYAAPRAPVADEAAVPPANFLPGGRGVPAARGWQWIVAGWDYFKRSAGMWIAIVVSLAVIFIVLAMVPILGSLAALVLTPVFTAGLMIGCRAQEEGRDLEIGHVFAGFRERFGALASVGLIYLALSIVIALVVGLATGAGMWQLMGGGEPDPVAMGAAGLTVLLAFLVMLALMLPVMMAVWFAAPLVVFHGQGPGEAMKTSFVACLKNIVPFLVYGAILLVAGVAASIPFGLGWLVLGPVIAASIYASYRDIFFE